MEASVVESGPGWALWRTEGGTFVEVVDDLACVLPEGVDAATVGAAWPRGRWTFTFTGTPVPYEAPMGVRADPLLTAAMTVLAAAKQARLHEARATFGELRTDVPAAGVAAATVTAVLDVRASREADRDALVEAVRAQAAARAERDRTSVEVTAGDVTGAVALDADAVAALVAALGAPTVSSPGADRAAALAVRGERAVALVLRHRDDTLVRAALAALP
ncbi:hypothetical protein [Mumia sp. ZJ430]|uniref:hypothetical protein n=1 Tax=Mumia sp. ZJ430 TaxID=2708083 RepID=UPI001420C658|nr:hypothetical protein [Mumia sp. ZJ430]